MNSNSKGIFIISLDFELIWGAHEKWSVRKHKNYFDKTREAIPKLLALFEKYNIHATWATVGFLFAQNKDNLRRYIPVSRPTYVDKNLNYYSHIETMTVGHDENVDSLHYAYSLINSIMNSPNQELASHTFCHYYCRAEGQTISQFEADINSAQDIATDTSGIPLLSLVFPRNQFNQDYINILKKYGIKVVRSNPDVWFWRFDGKLAAFLRAIDSIVPISKSLTYYRASLKVINGVMILPASRFLRPYRKNEKFIHGLKIRRIKREMRFAAKERRIYHLWWHPHNFGECMEENLIYLEVLLKEYARLNLEYQFESRAMKEMLNLD